ncbi:hypothetical protein SUDANB121_00075 [Nocardiopsis dassonvillei]
MKDVLQRARSRARSWLTPPRDATSDKGAATTEWILVIVVSIAIATTVGGILVGEFTTAAESIDLGVNR